MIGIFDSGVGGLTVAKEVLKQLPNLKIIYFGDTARLPYGTKGPEFVKRYSEKITNWLLNKGAKIIIVACHTSSAWAADFLKEKFKGIPIFEMITPVTRQAVSLTYGRKIGIIGTPGTIKSSIYDRKISEKNRHIKIYLKACPLFVPLAEEGLYGGKIALAVIKEYLSPLRKEKIDSLILGCTHYPLLKKSIQKVIGNRVKIVNPAEIVARELKFFLENNQNFAGSGKNGEKHQFFFSDEPYNFKKISRLCLKTHIEPIISDPFE